MKTIKLRIIILLTFLCSTSIHAKNTDSCLLILSSVVDQLNLKYTSDTLNVGQIEWEQDSFLHVMVCQENPEIGKITCFCGSTWHKKGYSYKFRENSSAGIENKMKLNIFMFVYSSDEAARNDLLKIDSIIDHYKKHNPGNRCNPQMHADNHRYILFHNNIIKLLNIFHPDQEFETYVKDFIILIRKNEK